MSVDGLSRWNWQVRFTLSLAGYQTIFSRKILCYAVLWLSGEKCVLPFTGPGKWSYRKSYCDSDLVTSLIPVLTWLSSSSPRISILSSLMSERISSPNWATNCLHVAKGNRYCLLRADHSTCVTNQFKPWFTAFFHSKERYWGQCIVK